MRRQLPPWAMGLAIAPLGFYFGFISTAMPILLSAKGVSVDEISSVSFIGFLPASGPFCFVQSWMYDSASAPMLWSSRPSPRCALGSVLSLPEI